MIYKRPPIVEAVIEVQVGTPIAKETLDKLQRQFLENYPAPPQMETQYDFQLSEEKANFQARLSAYKLTSADGANIVLIGPSRIGTVRLAPYEGWDAFVTRARDNWDLWKRAVGWQRITRIGVRYINRIDIPNPSEAPIELAEYSTVSPRMPTGIGLSAMGNFTVNTVAAIGNAGHQLILNVGAMPSPLVKTQSFMLDIDVSLDQGLPQNDEGLWSVVNGIREIKNTIFEACVTPKSRHLFSS
jgi:uncharacterized protein (TIGR04255 family)